MGGCCGDLSKERRSIENDTDGRNESCVAERTSHKKNDQCDATPLLQKADSAKEDQGYKTLNGSTDKSSQDIIEALLKQQSEDSDVKQTLLEQNKALNQELLQEREIVKETKAALEEARKVIAEDTRAMSHIMELKNTGRHEAANNPFSPTKLGARMKAVYEKEGLPLLEYFVDEVEGAKFLANWIKNCYDFCKKKADSQVTTFCFLDRMKVPNIDEVDDEWIRGHMRMMMSEDEFEYMYYLRWKTATSKEAIDSIKKEVSDTFSVKDEKYSHLYTDESKIAAVKSFLQMCAEVCWLIATCRPALHLQFDVENLKYESRIKKSFSVFATQKKVQADDIPPGVIIAVVCPALLTADDSIIMRGEVIKTDFNGGKGMEDGRSESKTGPMDKD